MTGLTAKRSTEENMPYRLWKCVIWLHEAAWKAWVFAKMFRLHWRDLKVKRYYFRHIQRMNKVQWVLRCAKYGWSWTKSYKDVYPPEE